MKKYDFTLIIPSLDPDEKLAATVTGAIAAGIDDIILIDDGSSEECRHYFTELEALPEVTLLCHPQNRGKGAALKTAFSYFLEHRPDRSGVVTADGDGQHRTEDIIACAEEMTNGESAVVLGCRDFTLPDVPPRSRFGNKMTSLVFRVFCGMRLSDTQTGLRAIPAEFIASVAEARGDRYEFETNMLLLMNRLHIPYREVKISTVYIDGNSASHFRPIRDSLRVYGLILGYIASSMISSGVDLIAFYFIGEFYFDCTTFSGMLATTVWARIISMTVNFSINKSVVFGNSSGIGRTLIRYICVAVPVMLASWLSVYAISELMALVLGADAGILHIGRTIIKIPVDIILFLISFRIQQKWVFAENDK